MNESHGTTRSVKIVQKRNKFVNQSKQEKIEVIHQPSGASSITWGQYRGLHMRRFFNCKNKSNNPSLILNWRGSANVLQKAEEKNDIIGGPLFYMSGIPIQTMRGAMPDEPHSKGDKIE